MTQLSLGSERNGTMPMKPAPFSRLTPVVIADAVCDALRPFGMALNSTPVRQGDVAAFVEDGEC